MSEQRLSLEKVRQDPPDPLCDCHTCQSARTIAACGDVLDRLRGLRADELESYDHEMGRYTGGYLDAIEQIETWLKQALGGTN